MIVSIWQLYAQNVNVPLNLQVPIFVKLFQFERSLGTKNKPIITVAVLYLGKKDGALAAGLGAALSDLLTGAMIWVLPTFIFKFIMGYIMGVVLEKGSNEKLDWIAGASLGGLFQCFAYTLFKIPLFTAAVAFASVPRLLAQTIMGLIIYAIIANVLAKSKVLSLQGVVA